MTDKRHCDVDSLCVVEYYDGNSGFNCRDEEERYQAFKARLMQELVAQNPNTVSGEHFEYPPKNFPLVGG